MLWEGEQPGCTRAIQRTGKIYWLRDELSAAKRRIGSHQQRNKKMKQADRPDSVTTGCPVMTAIPLGRELLHGSSFLPARSASNINACLFGIAPDGGYRVSPFVTQGAACALPSPKDSSLWPCSSPYTAVSRGFRRTAVNRHPALWSPDLPPAVMRRPAAVWLASSGILTDRRVGVFPRLPICPGMAGANHAAGRIFRP